MRNYLNEHGDSLTISGKTFDPKVDFANEALWACHNKVLREHTLVRGPLAQILLKYPADYTLSGPYCWMPFVEV